jgi:HEAT repeat protein
MTSQADSPDPSPPDAPDSPPIREDRPPGEPPPLRFLLQLFVIPLAIVLIIVAVWLGFSWLAHLESSPESLVRGLHRLNEGSWQDAVTLADMLRNPQYDQLRRDPALARELGQLLQDQLDGGKTERASIQLRVFLCRALGEFQVPEAAAPLLRAARQHRGPEEIDVRRAAVEAIAVYASNNDLSDPSQRREILEALQEIAREPIATSDRDRQRGELRSASAYALGILGGPEACDRLALLLSDVNPNTRYNAAIGLARHGDPRCVDVLREILDPENTEPIRDEPTATGRQWKQRLILENGIRAVLEFASQNPDAPVASLITALAELQDAELAGFPTAARRGLRIRVADALRQLEPRQANDTP